MTKREAELNAIVLTLKELAERQAAIVLTLKELAERQAEIVAQLEEIRVRLNEMQMEVNANVSSNQSS